MLQLFRENVKIATQSIRSQLLRAIITMTIIAIGISALVGILTAIDAIQFAISNNLAQMGANTFTINTQGNNLHHSKRGKKHVNHPAIRYDEAVKFTERYEFNALTSISYNAGSGATLRYNNHKTDPNASIVAADENYLQVAGLEVSIGRNFNHSDLELNRNNIILGQDLYKKMFPSGIDPVGKKISLNSRPYIVVGILKEKGNSMGFSGDRSCIIPITHARSIFSNNNSYTIDVMSFQNKQLDAAVDMAIHQFRVIRKLTPGSDNNFEITKSDELAKTLLDNISTLKAATQFIGIITLLGAAIALMNIMLVTVTERTREIGIRKAIGASAKTIRWQFLIEAIIICQIGGIIGIFGGIMLGNIVSIILDSAFFIPWVWIFSGIVVCIFVGLVSGLYPAIKASKLDPIESLRYE